jgi:hypothetical protein
MGAKVGGRGKWVRGLDRVTRGCGYNHAWNLEGPVTVTIYVLAGKGCGLKGGRGSRDVDGPDVSLSKRCVVLHAAASPGDRDRCHSACFQLGCTHPVPLAATDVKSLSGDGWEVVVVQQSAAIRPSSAARAGGPQTSLYQPPHAAFLC